jgi:hypothetical protein
MITATVRINGKTEPVEVLDAYDGSAGRKLASVRALAGKPFAEWTHGGWSYSDTARFPAEILQNVKTTPDKVERPNLLSLALAKAKPQWYVGEVVHIWKDRAFLMNDDCFVRLYVRGCFEGLTIFRLNLHDSCWENAINLEQRYQEWAAKAQMAIAGQTPTENKPAVALPCYHRQARVEA